MLSINNKEYIWVEKYRPKTVDDIILPEELKNDINQWIKDGEIPNLLLTGTTPGTGKSSLSHTLISELDADTLFINASLERNIDMLKDKIQGFVSTSSFNNKPKLVILDEADGLNANSTQPALRGFIEKFSKNARFILTANYKNKLIEPLRNRLIEINFDEMYNKHKPELIKQTALRALKIAENENIDYDKNDVIWLVKHFYPSSRKIINKLQESSATKKLIVNKDDIDIESVVEDILKGINSKNFDAIRSGINKMPDPSLIYETLFNHIETFDKTKRPQIIIVIAKYQAWDAHVRDRLINAVACAVEISTI